MGLNYLLTFNKKLKLFETCNPQHTYYHLAICQGMHMWFTPQTAKSANAWCMFIEIYQTMQCRFWGSIKYYSDVYKANKRL